MATIYVWTSWAGSIHQLWDVNRQQALLKTLPPKVQERLDGGYCPGSLKAPDGKLTLPDFEAQVEGLIRHYWEEGGYTILACWDRSSERTAGSNTTFVLVGFWEAAPALEMVREAFPEIWARLPSDMLVTAA